MTTEIIAPIILTTVMNIVSATNNVPLPPKDPLPMGNNYYLPATRRRIELQPDITGRSKKRLQKSTGEECCIYGA